MRSAMVGITQILSHPLPGRGNVLIGLDDQGGLWHGRLAATEAQWTVQWIRITEPKIPKARTQSATSS